MLSSSLAAIGIVCIGVVVVGLALVLSPISPGRLAYYAILIGGSTPRLVVIALAGTLLAAPAALQGRRRRGLGLATLGAGAFASALSAFLSAAVVRESRSHELSVSIRDSLFGTDRLPTSAPDEVTFAAARGWQLAADLYRPPSGRRQAQRVPAVVVVHGGAWHAGDKGETTALNHSLATGGYVVLDIQYRLAPAADWREQVADIWSAVAWLRSHADEFGSDPERVALLGRSAGGHLALLAAYAANDADFEVSGPNGPAPWCVIAVYAPTDLTRLYAETCHDVVTNEVCAGLRAVMTGSPSDTGDAYRVASPLEHVHRSVPPTLLIHGTSDRVVQPAHTQVLARSLEQVGAPVQVVWVPFAPHAFDLVPDALGTQLAREAVAAFLAQNR